MSALPARALAPASLFLRRAARPVLFLVLTALAALPAGPSAAQAPAEATKPPEAVPDSIARNPGPWKWDLPLSVFLTQSMYSSNWSGGDRGSIAWKARGELHGERQFSTRFNWRNDLTLEYGQSSEQVVDPNDATRLVWDPAEKSADLILFQSMARWTLGGWADPYMALRAESQFRDESSPIGTIWFNPWKLLLSAGVAKQFYKAEDRELTTRVGVGVRETFGASFVSADPVAKESFAATDGGFEWYTGIKQPLLSKRVLYRSDLLVFAPLFYSSSDALDEYDAAATAVDPGHRNVGDYWRVPDVNWRNSLTSNITKAIAVELYWQLVYDKFDTAANVDAGRIDSDLAGLDSEIQRNVRLAGQWKQQLSIGLTYALF